MLDGPAGRRVVARAGFRPPRSTRAAPRPGTRDRLPGGRARRSRSRRRCRRPARAIARFADRRRRPRRPGTPSRPGPNTARRVRSSIRTWRSRAAPMRGRSDTRMTVAASRTSGLARLPVTPPVAVPKRRRLSSIQSTCRLRRAEVASDLELSPIAAGLQVGFGEERAPLGLGEPAPDPVRLTDPQREIEAVVADAGTARRSASRAPHAPRDRRAAPASTAERTTQIPDLDTLLSGARSHE